RGLQQYTFPSFNNSCSVVGRRTAHFITARSTMARKQGSGGREQRSGKRKKKRSGLRLPLFLLLGGILVGGAVAAGVWILAVSGGKDGAAGSTGSTGSTRDQVLRYLPEGVVQMRYTAVARLLADPEYQKIKALIEPGPAALLTDPNSIPITQIERIVE